MLQCYSSPYKYTRIDKFRTSVAKFLDSAAYLLLTPETMLDTFEKGLWNRNVAHKLEKRKLLIAVNLVAGLSIFFFGYDQGVMGGVNTTRDYVRIMKIGHFDPDQNIVVVDHQLQQGGIVSRLRHGLINLLTVTERGLLSSWNAVRLLGWRMVR